MCSYLVSYFTFLSQLLLINFICSAVHISSKFPKFKRIPIDTSIKCIILPSTFLYEENPIHSLPTNEDIMLSSVNNYHPTGDLVLIDHLKNGVVSDEQINEQLSELQEHGLLPEAPVPPAEVNESLNSYNNDVKETSYIFNDINNLEHHEDSDKHDEDNFNDKLGVLDALSKMDVLKI